MRLKKIDEEALLQLWAVTWDGDLISKASRDALIASGLAQRAGRGFNMLTPDGVVIASNLLLVRGYGSPPIPERYLKW